MDGIAITKLDVLDGLKDESLHMSRFRGILDHLNILTKDSKLEIDSLFGKKMNVFHPDDIDWNNPPKNPSSFSKHSEELKLKCRNFIQDDKV